MDQFKTKKSLEEYTKDLIYNKIGKTDSIKQKSPEYWNFFTELFTRHPDYPEKIDGIVDISITSNILRPQYYQLNIIKYDGSIDDISFKSCISGKKKNNLKVAMRVSIQHQIIEFKKKNQHICVLCGSSEKVHVDHEIYFDKIITDFINTQLYVPQEFDTRNDNRPCFRDEDIEFEKNWIREHFNKAKLRILCEQCNLKRPKWKVT
jgi:5-methylcytosine-specific restriction endonuclease McrA